MKRLFPLLATGLLGACQPQTDQQVLSSQSVTSQPVTSHTPAAPTSAKAVTIETAAQWFEAGRQQANIKQSVQPETGRARNLILVIGDGMGITTLTSGRIFAGQQQGLAGEEYSLSFEQLPYSALIKTYNTDMQTPDSAGTMSAIMTGTKTLSGVLSVSPEVTKGDCVSQAGHDVTTLLEIAAHSGRATGVVTNTRITHATPAATYAHSVSRNWESDHQMPAAARAAGCQDIASQLISSRLRGESALPDIAMGGGRSMFLPAGAGGERDDQRNLINEWQQAGHHYLADRQALLQADIRSGAWLGLFADSHLPYSGTRGDAVPGLLDMTRKAVERLQQDADGYVLVIESGLIDHAHHEGKAGRALAEVAELDSTLAWLMSEVDFSNTLLLVTADHSHTLSLAGYPTRGNPILGVVVSNDEHGHPQSQPYALEDGGYYTSLNYRNGPGAVSLPRPGVNPQDTLDPDYRQQALVPLDSETHGGEDVAVYAQGPWAHLLGGTLEQHWLFHVMKHALETPAP